MCLCKHEYWNLLKDAYIGCICLKKEQIGNSKTSERNGITQIFMHNILLPIKNAIKV